MEIPPLSGVPELSPSALDEAREALGTGLKQMSSLINAWRALLPAGTGDGSYLPKAPKEADVEWALEAGKDLGLTSLKALYEVQRKLLSHEETDDRDYDMEKLIQAAAKIRNPVNPIGSKITDGFISALWNDLSHPPEMYLGDDYQYRKADGSYNSFLHPGLGAAHTPYARTVKPSTMTPSCLPDPGVIFDSVMARKKPEQHPSGISSMLFYLASIIIHDLFRTNHGDFRISDTSSYLDLSPLYGSDWVEQKRMRTFKDGRIKPDCFSEVRLLSFPPGVGALLIMFNRFHNYVVEQLAAIKEGGRFRKPGDDETSKWDKYDEDLFQTGRLITCGLYVNIILLDYVRTILNLNKTNDNWHLDPRIDIASGPAMGVGNQVSAEFNLVYRWHAAISDKDDRWSQALFAKLFNGRNPSEIPQREFLETLGRLEVELMHQDPLERQFDDLERQENGTYKDDDLVKILVDSVRDCANAYGPQQVPIVMRAVEVLGIQQARSWNLATLNEFREHFGLTPHRAFSDITSNKEVADALMHLYDTPDRVELYPGIAVEDAKEVRVPGSGLCPPYTVSRAVLSDAVALVRGDRFYTTSYHPKSLTNWGFSEANYDLNVDNGCVFYKLFLRAFPNSFEPNSVYVHYPLTIPTEMERVLKDLGKADKYDFDLPKPITQSQVVFSYAAAQRICNDNNTFKVTWGKAIQFLMGPKGGNFMLAGDGQTNAQSRQLMEQAMYMGPFSRSIPTGNEAWLREVRTFYEDMTTTLLKRKSYKLAGVNEVDIIRDVGNIAHVHFCAEMFAMPLKTPENNGKGLFTEDQLYMIMAAVFICVFFDVDPEHSFPLRLQARDATQALGQVMIAEIEIISKTGRWSERFEEWVSPSTSPLKDYGLHMIHRLLDLAKASDLSIPDLVWGNIMATTGGMVANQGQLFSQAINYYLTLGTAHLPAMRDLALRNDPEADTQLLHYLMEGSRLAGETGILRSVARPVVLHDYDRTLHLAPGATVLVALKAASRDPAVFPDPDAVHLHRPLESYVHLGAGVHQCLGLPMTRVALTTMLKTVVRLKGLRVARRGPADGDDAGVKKVLRPFPAGTRVHGKEVPEGWCYHAYLTEKWDTYFPFPTTLKINWDNED